MSYKGLLNYGFDDLAKEIKTRWLTNQQSAVYAETGKMTEKYNVFSNKAEGGGGEYPKSGWLWLDEWSLPGDE
jgi:alpha,alpha-trehalase